jgi:hypothetical protein
MPDDPLIDAYKTPDQLKDFGLPEKFTQAFLKTAETTNCVLMTRVPGKATNQLIEERYDLKGYFIKTKSCNWGPMSGFVCQLPLFNKSGVDGMAKNTSATKNYEENYFDKKNPENKGKRKPFVQLEISELQKGVVLRSVDSYEELDKNVIVGIASDKAKTVYIEFIMQKTEHNTWALFNGKVYYKYPSDEEWKDYTTDPTWIASGQTPLDLKTDIKDSVVSQLIIAWANINNDLAERAKNHVGGNFYPIMGIQNPFSPYEGNESYKNAVTGDYDLFATWPIIPSEPYTPWRDLVRYSEQYITTEATYPQFIPATGKKYSVRSTVSENVIVECIPGADVLKAGRLEDPDAGNYNNLTLIVAQTLNSFVTYAHGGKKSSPNAAFHSDEGGRPGINEIDFDVAVFLPPGLRDPGEPLILLIENVFQFVSLIELLKDKCYVFLHYGWLMHLFTLCRFPDDLPGSYTNPIDNRAYAYFHKRSQEAIKLFTSGELAKVCDALKKLFVRPGRETPDNAFESLSAIFAKFAKEQELGKNLPSVEQIKILTSNPIQMPDEFVKDGRK